MSLRASPENGALIVQHAVHSGENQQWLCGAPAGIPTPPRDNYAGVYTLTITARSCSPGFPEGGTSAASTPRVSSRRVPTCECPCPVPTSCPILYDPSGGGTFTGTVERTGEITFWIAPLSWWEFYGTDLEERLSDGTVLLIFGTIRATGTPAGISGTAGDDATQDAGLGGILHLPPRGFSWSRNDAT